MTLEHVFFLSQTIAAVAVVVSIVYLAREVRQSERVQRAIMQQGRADRVSKTSLTMAHPDLARIWQKALSAQPDMTPAEFVQWSLLCRAAFLSGEDSVLQHKAGTLDEGSFRSYQAGAKAFMAFPAFRAMWQVSRTQYGPDFQEFADRLMATVHHVPPPDLYMMWQDRLKAESASPHQ